MQITKTYMLVLSLLFAVSILGFATTNVKANHGLEVEDCLLEYRQTDADEYDLCVEHSVVDKYIEDCGLLENPIFRQDCIDGVTPASDGYDGTPGSAGSTGETSEPYVPPEYCSGLEPGAPRPIECDFGTQLNVNDLDDDNKIISRLQQVVNFLSVGVGIVITGSVIVAGIQWSTTRGNPQSQQKAVQRLWSAGTALMLYVFMWAIINWLIPGGPLS